jgi:hypothetical protein
MMHEVKIFDGKGNLIEIIQPVFNYDCNKLGRTRNKACGVCGKYSELSGNQKFCGATCAGKHKRKRSKLKREANKKAREARPAIPCEVCGKPVAAGRYKYCGKVCDNKVRKLNALAKQAKTAEIIKFKRQEIRNDKIASA